MSSSDKCCWYCRDWDQQDPSFFGACKLHDCSLSHVDVDVGCSNFTLHPEYEGEAPKLPYREYLRSPEWRVKRHDALHRAGYKCERCGHYSTKLDVHHKTYERLGNERAEDLMVVCRSCHEVCDDYRRATKAFSTWCDRRGIEQPDDYEWEKFNQWRERKQEEYG